MEEAKLNVKNLPISTKQSIEICRFIRNMKLQKAKFTLNNVINMKQAVPYIRHKMNIPHKAGIASGRYPIKASSQILKLLESTEHNAIKEGMSKDLVIAHISADKGIRQWHGGRQRRRKTKSTNIRIILKEQEKDNAKTEIKNKIPKQKK